jgi:hypothetical protein
MIQVGKSITSKDDPLQKIKVEYLYHKLLNPDAEIASKIRQLHIVRQMDSKQYAFLKRQLPYIVCGIFSPAFRRTENFAYTEYFMVDIDKLEEKELSVASLRLFIEGDTRVLMCFASPSQDGLKVMFKLKERCYDAGIYSIFYKLFLLEFAKQYSLEQVVDTRTSDVARACFVSVDANAYYNEQAESVDINAYINTEDTSALFRIKKELEADKSLAVRPVEKLVTSGPDDDVIQKIKSLLNPKALAISNKRDAFVPEELNLLMEMMVPFIEQTGIKVNDIVNIQFGKKIKMQTGLKQAEINLFYGKKGYSVVQTPRRGVNDELNAMMSDLITQFIFS